MGKAGDAETSGGGRIVILAESIVMQGFGTPLSANAKPYQSFVAPYREPGGSGGYIYVNTHNKYLKNQINEDVRIESLGGFGTNGGSGGVIIFDSGFSMPDS